MSVIVDEFSKTSGKFDLILRKGLLMQLSKLEHARLKITDPLEEIVLGSNLESDLQTSIQVLDCDFYRKVALGGSIGAAEAYRDGLWQADDLTQVVQIMVRNRDLLDSMEGGLASFANKLLTFWHLGNRNTATGSQRNIAAHYDLSNELFQLFLDRHGMYSSATFYSPDVGLELASTDKLDRICRKLDLCETDHLLEIGTGWGGFAAYAAKQYGCKVTTTTISKAQYQSAKLRMQLQGVDDQVTVVMQDYRDLQGQFDKLVSIEMIEAVGHQYLDTYLQKCATLLKSNGLALIQAISIEDWRYHQALKSVDFIQRYIFPGSFIPSVSAIVESTSRCTDFRLINLEDQGDSYALTMKHWRDRLMDRLDEVRQLGFDDQFIRLWEFYLAYCEGGFKEKSISSIQLLLAKPGNRRPQWLPVDEA